MIFTRSELQSIEKTLYQPKQEELYVRSAFSVNTGFEAGASEIGFDVYSRTGSAKVRAAGGKAKDINFVGDERKRYVQPVFKIETGIEWTEDEMSKLAKRRMLNQGADVPLDTLRVASARRYVNETEQKSFLVGEAGMKGALQYTGQTIENVALGAVGGSDAEKRLFANKTPDEKLKDLLAAKTAIEKDNLFKGRVLMMPPTQYLSLLKPYSTQNPMTVLQWLNSEGMFFEKIIPTSAMMAEFNGFGVDIFWAVDNDPEVIQLAVLEDMRMRNPVVDEFGDVKQTVTLSTAGCIFRHEAAGYIGKGI